MWEIFLLQISLGSSYINCPRQVETISMPQMFKKTVYKIRVGKTYAGNFFSVNCMASSFCPSQKISDIFSPHIHQLFGFFWFYVNVNKLIINELMILSENLEEWFQVELWTCKFLKKCCCFFHKETFSSTFL